MFPQARQNDGGLYDILKSNGVAEWLIDHMYNQSDDGMQLMNLDVSWRMRARTNS